MWGDGHHVDQCGSVELGAKNRNDLYEMRLFLRTGIKQRQRQKARYNKPDIPTSHITLHTFSDSLNTRLNRDRYLDTMQFRFSHSPQETALKLKDGSTFTVQLSSTNAPTRAIRAFFGLIGQAARTALNCVFTAIESVHQFFLGLLH